jgi:RNA polymerase sigma factor (sigma-70 family)
MRDVTGKDPFEAIVARHGATVWRVCRAVVGPADADDAWSETFMAALRAYPELPGDANVQAWLVTIAHRKAIDVARAAGRRAVPLDATRLPDVATDDANADGTDDVLVEALTALPIRQRRAVLYHHVAGLPYAEVAALLGGSVVAARRAAADGMATLRRTYPGALARQGANS